MSAFNIAAIVICWLNALMIWRLHELRIRQGLNWQRAGWAFTVFTWAAKLVFWWLPPLPPHYFAVASPCERATAVADGDTCTCRPCYESRRANARFQEQDETPAAADVVVRPEGTCAARVETAEARDGESWTVQMPHDWKLLRHSVTGELTRACLDCLAAIQPVEVPTFASSDEADAWLAQVERQLSE